MASPFASELLQRAETVSDDRVPWPSLDELPLAPLKIIFCCFDPRVYPEKFLDLKYDDRALLIRNASGTPARNIPDIVAIDKLRGVSEIIVIKHTDCGATYLTDDLVREHIVKHNPALAGKVDDLSVQATIDIAERTRLDVEIIKSSPLIRKELRATVSGLLYDIKTGKVDRIV